LNEPVEGHPARAAVDCRDDASRHRALEAERVANRDRRLADLETIRVADRCDWHVRYVDANHSYVERRIAADHTSFDAATVSKTDAHRAGHPDDVGVRQYDAIRVHDDSRAGAAFLL
jgi:hypothetical protein